MGKGSKPRPQTVSREELDLRYEFAWGRISKRTYCKRYAELKRTGLIKRSGRVLK